MATPPPVGDVKPSNLYADAQSRALWLGVPTNVDPNGAVLVSDIMQTAVDIAMAESRANAFTNSQVATRAPLAHQHVAADITDFAAAVDAATADNSAIGFLRGMIVLWNGLANEVGVGPLAGWALCDGATYNVGGTNVTTPNLVDRFVIGAGNKAPGSKNNLGFTVTADGGSHTHVVNPTAISEAQMPPHTHAVTGSGSGGTDAQGVHAHGIHIWGNSNDAGGHVRNEGTEDRGIAAATELAGNHAHNVSVTISGTAAAAGSGQGHTHTTQAGGVHNHQVTSQQIRDTIPYYALCYIMKL